MHASRRRPNPEPDRSRHPPHGGEQAPPAPPLHLQNGGTASTRAQTHAPNALPMHSPPRTPPATPTRKGQHGATTLSHTTPINPLLRHTTRAHNALPTHSPPRTPPATPTQKKQHGITTPFRTTPIEPPHRHTAPDAKITPHPPPTPRTDTDEPLGRAHSHRGVSQQSRATRARHAHAR